MPIFEQCFGFCAANFCKPEPDFLKCFVCFTLHLKRGPFTKWRGRQTKHLDFLKVLHFMPRFLPLMIAQRVMGWRQSIIKCRESERERDDILGQRRCRRSWVRHWNSIYPRAAASRSSRAEECKWRENVEQIAPCYPLISDETNKEQMKWRAKRRANFDF